MKKYLVFLGKLFLILFVFSSASFANTVDPKEFVQIIVDDAKKILVATNTPEYKSEKLIEIAKDKVDIKGIGLYTLGSYRKKLSDSQKKKCRTRKVSIKMFFDGLQLIHGRHLIN